MLRLVVRRLLFAGPTVLVLTLILFIGVTTTLGSPASMMLGKDASPQAIAALDAQYGFDRPVLVQYFDWLRKALVGDLGRSFITRAPVASEIAQALPVTLELAVLAIALAALGATTLNSLPLARRLIRPLVGVLDVVGVTMPNFFIGLVLIFLFSVRLHWLPSIGWVPWSDGIVANLTHVVLPVLTLSAYYFGAFSLVYRAEFEAACRKLYIRAARAKGVSETGVAFRHALPNAILPVITFAGLSMGQLVGGAVVTETVFSMPGIGRLFVDAITERDFPVMLAIGMLVVAGVVIMNLIADLLYLAVNPQIRLR
ncbi:MAG: ABC transporter permease [Acetobacteraceae bacterium]